MPNTKLLIRLRDLHEELALINDDLETVETIDDETIDALGQLVTDVGSLVDKAKHADIEDTTHHTEHQDLLDRISEFNTRHPKVSKFLTQMTDILAMMGI